MVKQITVDENNVVRCCSMGGYIEGGIDVEDIPDEVMSCPAKWIYEGGRFAPNPNYIEIDINDIKASKIAESKDKLAEWLANNPMLYTDGKLYSVTAEKQSLLNSNLASYERAQAAGVDYPLRWNSTGDECVVWTYEGLVSLSLEIAAYVAPKVSAQQEIELAINACESVDELNKVVISYD